MKSWTSASPSSRTWQKEHQHHGDRRADGHAALHVASRAASTGARRVRRRRHPLRSRDGISAVQRKTSSPRMFFNMFAESAAARGGDRARHQSRVCGNHPQGHRAGASDRYQTAQEFQEAVHDYGLEHGVPLACRTQVPAAAAGERHSRSTTSVRTPNGVIARAFGHPNINPNNANAEGPTLQANVEPVSEMKTRTCTRRRSRHRCCLRCRKKSRSARVTVTRVPSLAMAAIVLRQWEPLRFATRCVAASSGAESPRTLLGETGHRARSSSTRSSAASSCTSPIWTCSSRASRGVGDVRKARSANMRRHDIQRRASHCAAQRGIKIESRGRGRSRGRRDNIRRCSAPGTGLPDARAPSASQLPRVRHRHRQSRRMLRPSMAPSPSAPCSRDRAARAAPRAPPRRPSHPRVRCRAPASTQFLALARHLHLSHAPRLRRERAWPCCVSAVPASVSSLRTSALHRAFARVDTPSSPPPRSRGPSRRAPPRGRRRPNISRIHMHNSVLAGGGAPSCARTDSSMSRRREIATSVSSVPTARFFQGYERVVELGPLRSERMRLVPAPNRNRGAAPQSTCRASPRGRLRAPPSSHARACSPTPAARALVRACDLFCEQARDSAPTAALRASRGIARELLRQSQNLRARVERKRIEPPVNHNLVLIVAGDDERRQFAFSTSISDGVTAARSPEPHIRDRRPREHAHLQRVEALAGAAAGTSGRAGSGGGFADGPHAAATSSVTTEHLPHHHLHDEPLVALPVELPQ